MWDIIITFTINSKPHKNVIPNLGLHEDQLAVARGEVIVDDDVDPLAVLPEAKVEDAGVFVAEALVQRHYLVMSYFIFKS